MRLKDKLMAEAGRIPPSPEYEAAMGRAYLAAEMIDAAQTVGYSSSVMAAWPRLIGYRVGWVEEWRAREARRKLFKDASSFAVALNPSPASPQPHQQQPSPTQQP